MPVPSKPPVSTPTSNDMIVGSASTSGQMIAVSGTNAAGATTLHTVPIGMRDFQRVLVYAVNIDTVERTLTLCLGGIATKDQMPIKIGPQRGLVMVLPGLKFYRGQVIKAFCPTANIFNCAVGVGERDKSP